MSWTRLGLGLAVWLVGVTAAALLAGARETVAERR
jgi:type IV secretory pathway TrbD component